MFLDDQFIPRNFEPSFSVSEHDRESVRAVLVHPAVHDLRRHFTPDEVDAVDEDGLADLRGTRRDDGVRRSLATPSGRRGYGDNVVSQVWNDRRMFAPNHSMRARLR